MINVLTDKISDKYILRIFFNVGVPLSMIIDSFVTPRKYKVSIGIVHILEFDYSPNMPFFWGGGLL